jgi:myo-inositol-1(or 4)-monophosphatase
MDSALTPRSLRLFIANVLWEVSESIASQFGHTGPLTFKYGREAITQVDRQVEDKIAQAVLARFPGHRFVGEEAGERGAEGAEWSWQVDPIDGTLNYSVGIPVFSSSVAVLHRGVLQAGGVLDPLRRELFTAGRGEGAFVSRRDESGPLGEEQRLEVSERERFAEAVVSTQFGRRSLFVDHPQLLQQMLRHPLKTRRLGSIAIELAWLAAGRIDLLLAGKRSPINFYDIAAGVILVEEAGGRISDGHGESVDDDCREIIASNGHLHEELVEILRPWLSSRD